MKVVDDLLDKGDEAGVVALLVDVDIEAEQVEVLLGQLTATLRIRLHPSRETFKRKVQAKLVRDHGWDRANTALNGL